MSDEGAQIAGHPLVRALRRDAEREVWVAADGPAGDADGVELHRSLAGAESVIAREAEALLAAGHPHLVPILDLATDGGAVLVRPLLPLSLADWLVQRQAPSPGEAVTALAPIAAALGALHAVGARAGGCTAGAVRLDGDGAPLLLGEGAQIETARPTQAWLESSEGVGADVDGWRRLLTAVLDACGRSVPERVDAALAARDMTGAGAALLAEWPALPLALPPLPTGTADAPADARHAWSRQAGSRQALRARDRGRPSVVDALLARVALLAEAVVERGGRAAPRIVQAVGAVRPRFWGVAAVGAAALIVAAVALWPQGEGASRSTAAAPLVPATSGPAPVPAAEPTALADADGVGAGGSASDRPTSDDAASDGGVVESPEQAVAAVAALLVEREACIAAGDAACLAVLHEPSSPQLTAAEPWRMPDDGTLVLVQRLGDAWLLRVDSEREPASVLAMSTEAGWTLRDAWVD
ncbi:hypothetical protein AA0Z99_04195 [Agrococcus sp. 1P02AA]|uniref:hypothetical protein n=1 Tax=Agrococcus sp. 1P02AA TaxID=3132259 RepID=UPI0039A66CB1